MKKLQVILFCILITSCVSRKEIIYFQNDAIQQAKVNNSYETVFKPDDLLQITVSSKDIEAVKSFNLPAVTYMVSSDNPVGNPVLQTYLVDNNGEINFPVIGRIKIAGLSREQAISFLKSKLSPDYLKNPSINIRIVNYSISILGDVKKPGSYTIPNERITILDALALAGDANISASRKGVEVIREEKGKKVKYYVDLLSNLTFTSPVYYLQQNDIIYVKHNKASMQSASYNQNTGLFISIASVLITLISVLR